MVHNETPHEKTNGRFDLFTSRGSAHPRWISVLALLMLLAACWIGYKAVFTPLEAATERIRRTGSIRIGYAVEPPFAFMDTQGKITGESPEVATAIWKHLGINRIEWVQADFGSLIPLLRAGRIDQIASGLFIRPERQKLVAFTHASACLEPALLVRKGNPLNLHSYEDFASRPGAKLAVLAGAVEGDDAAMAGVAAACIIKYPHPDIAIQGIRNTLVDGLALSGPSIQQLVQQYSDMEQALPFHAGSTPPGCGAFAFRKDDTQLRDQFDSVLKTFIGTAEHLELIRPFGFTEKNIPAPAAVQPSGE